MSVSCPRLVIAATAGDSGKTLTAMGLLAAWRAAGLDPAPFKKGPDYIDAAWLGRAAGRPCRNLDTFVQSPARLERSFRRHASPGVSLVEGNRGLLDGADAAGTHSTAALARLLRAPVLLVASAAKVTRTVAAPVLGCLRLEPDLTVAGVVLNRVSSSRHQEQARRAVEELCGVPVLGCLPRLDENLIPGRHLGLLPPEEHPEADATVSRLAALAREHLDLPRILEAARRAPPLPSRPGAAQEDTISPAAVKVRVGVFRDSAFTFYYPENLEALEAAGAELCFISPLEDGALPGVDALYIGGGFPETHAARLAGNQALHAAVRRAAQAGLPIYAECGGLIFLSRSLHVEGREHRMAGVLPVELELCARPQGHGYVQLSVDTENPFFPVGTELRGHEFHYTRLREGAELPPSAFRVLRGSGCGGGRDGLFHRNVIGGYTHLHALGAPQWAPGLVRLAGQARTAAASPRS
jgi:cobyrinic acid a,c-diamide synthase